MRVETGVLGSIILTLSNERVDPSAVAAALVAAAVAGPADPGLSAAARFCVRVIPFATTAHETTAGVAAAAAAALPAACPSRTVDSAVVYRWKF